MLPHVLVLEMGTHRNLPLEPPVANGAMIGQCLGMGGEMLGQMILAEKPLLAHFALVGLHPSVSHFVSPHVGPI